MAELIEDVLEFIFDYLETPVDWVQISEVCQLWKSAATKHWRKIRTITFEPNIPDELKSKKMIPEITTEDAERIVKCAAPYVQVLDTFFRRWSSRSEFNQHIQFGPFLYKVVDFNPAKILKLIAKYADKLTEVKLYEAPKPELLHSLIKGKKIRMFKFKHCNNFYEHVSTDDIEKLDLQFDRSEIIRPFQGHFLNLKELHLTLTVNYLSSGLGPILSPILPHVLGLKAVAIQFIVSGFPSSRYAVSCETLMGLTKLPELEELFLNFYRVDSTDVDSFIEQLAEGCLKLRVVCFVGMEFTGDQIRTLLSLPNLDSLDLTVVLSFRFTELSKMSNLTQLRMRYSDWTTLDIENFCNALKKMPKLELFEMNVRPRNEQSEFEFVRQVILVVVLQNKDVLVSDQFGSGKWKISRNNAEYFDTATLELELFHVTARTFSNKIKTFVQNYLDNYIVVECPKEDD